MAEAATVELTRVTVVSVHEAAHAAAAAALGIGVEAATIRADAEFMGSCYTAFPEGDDPALWTMPELERFSLLGSMEPGGKAYSPRTRQNPRLLERFPTGAEPKLRAPERGG